MTPWTGPSRDRALHAVLAALALGLLIGPPARAAIPFDEAVGLAAGVVADGSAACNWPAGLIDGAIEAAEGAVVKSGSAAVAADQPRVSLSVLTLKQMPGKRSVDVALVARADVRAAGRLVATRDFVTETSYKLGADTCGPLREAAATIGAQVAEWATKARWPVCGEGCAGLHPDEPIVIAAEVLLGKPDALNDTVRNECRWPTEMVKRLVTGYNEGDPKPRAPLEARAIDIQAYTGRRLVLRVLDVHALGGGGWTGPKWMTLTGELYDGDWQIGSFSAHTTSGRGLTTCRSVDSLSDSAAWMITEWLRAPTLNASLQ